MMKMSGLTNQEAAKRLNEYGLNEIKETNKHTWYKILFNQVKNNFVVYFLIVAVILSFLIKNNITAYTICGVIFLVVFLGFIQEYKAEKAIDALKNMILPTSVVIREGKEHEISSKEIVPGDILLIRDGEKIPADAIILEQSHLLVNEAILTGESREIAKIEIIDQDNITPENEIYMGTYVLNGKCLAEVRETGMRTKFGQIANLISESEKPLPLQTKLNKILTVVVIIGIVLSVLAGVLMFVFSPVLSKEVFVNAVLLVIALSVSVFPEGAPVALISTLSYGAFKMAKQNAVVSRISIIETLGETTVICSDKTGTITKGEMTVKKIFVNNEFIDVSGVGYEKEGEFLINNKPVNSKELDLLIKTGVICNNSFMDEDKVNGTPTESALLVLGAKKNIYKDDLNINIIDELPFNSNTKMMSVLSREDKDIVYTKGAPEVILEQSNKILVKGKLKTFSVSEKKKILEKIKELNIQSFRTLALAYKDKDTKNLQNNLTFLGFVALEDPPRDEVKETIEICKNAGIAVKMITGDNLETALSVAKQIGLDTNNYLVGEDLDKLSEEELREVIADVRVFARVRPEHKIKIVKALKDNGEIVTMTGDGVNDAPALKEAHVGVAMGKTGTDVSRSVADLVLKDDNFATIVNAIKEGRTIFNNIRKFLTYQFSCNFSEAFIIIIGVVLAFRLGWAIPLLLPLQILFMNMVTDNLPAITLGLNPSPENIMDEKPRHKGLLTKNLIILIIIGGVFIGLLVLASYYLSFNILGHSADAARTVALTTLIVLEVVAAFAYRSFSKKVLTRSPFTNKFLFYASGISIIATIAIIYTSLSKIFGTVPIMFNDWLLIILIGLFFALVSDVVKTLNNKYRIWSLE